MSKITELLAEARGGDASKLDAVFGALYPELKRLAAARAAALAPGATLSATALVHETYIKFVESSSLDPRDRRHFFACAAKVMREILIDYLRAGSAAKRGGGVRPVTLPSQVDGELLDTDLLDLNRALDDLDQVNPKLRVIVELRYFAGLSSEAIAELEKCSLRTVHRDWKRARAFLMARLEQPGP